MLLQIENNIFRSRCASDHHVSFSFQTNLNNDNYLTSFMLIICNHYGDVLKLVLWHETNSSCWLHMWHTYFCSRSEWVGLTNILQYFGRNPHPKKGRIYVKIYVRKVDQFYSQHIRSNSLLWNFFCGDANTGWIFNGTLIISNRKKTLAVARCRVFSL